jgi:hypothetical protein
VIHWFWAEHDGAFGCEYHFQHNGEFLPEHRHKIFDGHTVRCLRGRAWLRFQDKTGIEFTPAHGDISFDVTRYHTVVALCDGTVIFNRLTNRPDDWQQMLGTGEQL